MRVFERRGLADKLPAGPVAQTIDYRVDGVSRIFEAATADDIPSRCCIQQMLVNNLLRELIDVMGGDVRFGVSDVTIRNEAGESPRVGWYDAGGAHELACAYVVGCDGLAASAARPSRTAY